MPAVGSLPTDYDEQFPRLVGLYRQQNTVLITNTPRFLAGSGDGG